MPSSHPSLGLSVLFLFFYPNKRLTRDGTRTGSPPDCIIFTLRQVQKNFRICNASNPPKLGFRITDAKLGPSLESEPRRASLDFHDAMVLVYHNQEWRHVRAAGRRPNGEIDLELYQALIDAAMRERWDEWRRRIHKEYLQPLMFISLELVFELPQFCLVLLLLFSSSPRA